jgi:hypothetical protein
MDAPLILETWTDKDRRILSSEKQNKHKLDDQISSIGRLPMNKFIKLSIKNKGSLSEFLRFFKNNTKYKRENMNEVAEWLALTNEAFLICHRYEILLNCINISLELDEAVKNDYKLNELTVYMLVTYCLYDRNHYGKPFFVDENLDKIVTLCVDYEVIHKVAIKYRHDIIIYKIFDKLKITKEYFDTLISSKLVPKDLLEKFIVKFMTAGIFPTKEDSLRLGEMGIDVGKITPDSKFISGNISCQINQIDQNDRNDLELLIAKIKGNCFDLKGNKRNIIEVNGEGQSKLKQAIYENVHYYTPKQLDTLSKIFNLKYDEECMQALCRVSCFKCNNNVIKAFRYLVDSGVEPDYKSMCNLVSKMTSLSQINKLFCNNTKTLQT